MVRIFGRSHPDQAVREIRFEEGLEEEAVLGQAINSFRQEHQDARRQMRNARPASGSVK